MKGIRFGLRGRNKRKAALLAGAGLFLAFVIGGGAYAALGGQVRQSAVGDIDLQKGLVGHWKLDGNAKDSSPFRRNGVVTGTTNITDRKGRVAGAKMYNGLTDGIAISGFTNTVLKNADFDKSWTLAIWAKAGNIPTSERLLFGKSGFNSGIMTTVSGGYRFAVWNSAGSAPTTINYSPANINTQWRLIVATYSNGTMTLYGDGQLVGTTNASTMYNYDNTLRIGSTANNYFFNGALDDARAYDRALTASEAKALYESYDPGIQAGSGQNGLVSHWKLDGNAKDSGPNRNHGTVTGATLSTDRKGRANSAYSFTPTTNKIDTPGDSLYSSVFTYSAWVYPTGSGSRTIIGTSSSGGPQLRVNAANGLTLLKQGMVQYVSTGVGLVPNNQWTHVGVSYDASGNFIYYINGQSYGPYTNLQTYSFDAFNIGRGAYTSEAFSGKIDDLRVYNRIVTPGEMRRQYESYESQINLNSSPTNNQASGNINQGLIGYFPFSGSAKDATPYRNNGTVIGATLTTDRYGRANNAYAFNGTSSTKITIPASAYTSTTGTWSLWAKAAGFPSADNYLTLIDKSSTYYGCGGIGINGESAGYGAQIKAIGHPICDEYYSPSTSPPGIGEWRHIALSFSGNGVADLYMDGQLVSSESVGINWSFAAAPLVIGYKNDIQYAPVQGFNGSIDDVRIYDRVLTAPEIQALYKLTN